MIALIIATAALLLAGFAVWRSTRPPPPVDLKVFDKYLDAVEMSVRRVEDRMNAFEQQEKAVTIKDT